HRAALDRLELVAVHMTDLRLDLSDDRPRDRTILLVARDDDGDVVLAHRVVVERLAVHVDDELVAHLRRRLTRRALQHARAVDGHVALRVAQHREDARRVEGDHAPELDALALLVFHLFGHDRIVPPDPSRRPGRVHAGGGWVLVPAPG